MIPKGVKVDLEVLEYNLMKNIKHIFFDLDHTLWDFEENSKKTYQQLFAENNINLKLDVFLTHYIPVNHQYWKLYREERVSKEKLRYGRLKDVFDALHYSISDELIHKLATDYIINLPNYNQLFDGSIELLEYLFPKYKLHIITNGFKEIQQTKLENAGIAKYFDNVITSENVGVKKPNPKVFHFALEKTKAKTYESIMIGDNLEADIYGAKNVGMKAVFFNPVKQNAPKNIKEINHLLEIRDIL